MENEIWKDVVGYEGLYQVSNLGKVKSLERIRKYRKGVYGLKKEIILKQASSQKYLTVCLTNFFCIKKTITIHRLVAIAFIPNPDSKPQVNHKDGNKFNNVFNNLEWVTSSENLIHALETKLKVPKYGKDNHRFGKTGSLTGTSKIVLDKETGIFYECANDAAIANNIKYSTLSSWLSKRRFNPKRFIHV